MLGLRTLGHYLSVTRMALQKEKAHGEKSNFNRNEREFQAAAIEILETPPSPAGRILGGALISLFVLALIWSAVSRVDVYASLQGKVIPTGNVKVIEPLTTGKVKAIHVRNGQMVKQGKLLIELDPEEQAADRARLEADLIVSETASLRLKKAMKAILDVIPAKKVKLTVPEQVPSPVRLMQERILIQTLKRYEAEQATFISEKKQRMMELQGAKATVRERADLVAVMAERVDMLAKLAKRGSGSRASYLERAQLLYEQRAGLARDKGRIGELKAAVKAISNRAKERRETMLQKLVIELADNEKRISTLRQELRKARLRETQSELRAPVSGTVQQLVVHTIGDVVSTGQRLMIIVPEGSKLEIEALLLNKDKGFVKEAQTARVKIEAFPFTKYGVIQGKILTVSNDAISSSAPHPQSSQNRITDLNGLSASANRSLVFPVRIALARNTIRVEEEEVNLSPGMSVTAEVKTGDRRLIEFLLSPLMRIKDEALRER